MEPRSGAEPRIIWSEQLIGSATVCKILGIDRSTLTRRIAKGAVPYLAQLDGSTGAFVFDRSDFPEETE
ncbi:hypothetical protein [Mycetocola saprophilus]|uniref:hypothetical protein n=1 Tax=Mycetocola saprophilus TaxID=76636 RepID=UPI003BF0A94A